MATLDGPSWSLVRNIRREERRGRIDYSIKSELSMSAESRTTRYFEGSNLLRFHRALIFLLFLP